MIRDGEYAWSTEVISCVGETESVNADIDLLINDLRELTRTISNLRTASFDDDVEDYEIRHKAQQLWDAVSSGASDIRSRINDARSVVNDTRRVVDFYP